jgi:YbbR domain-containing protein
VMLLNPVIVGAPAPGYVITNVTVEPPTVLAGGQKAVIDGLVQKLSGSTASVAALNLERIDVTNARQDITQSKQVERPANVFTDRQTVVVKIEIRPAISSATLIVAPTVDGPVPAGMIIENTIITTNVRVSGQATAIQNLKASDVKATFSLAGATEGQATYQVKATAPAGITVESVDPVVVTLRTVPTP